jgi:hypothetical protein
MIEPNYLVSLNSKPTHCDMEPDGPWAADVFFIDATDPERKLRDVSARWLVAQRKNHHESIEELNGEPGYLFHSNSLMMFVPEYDVEHVYDLEDVMEIAKEL